VTLPSPRAERVDRSRVMVGMRWSRRARRGVYPALALDAWEYDDFEDISI
jgi:hypothetical protein